MGPDLIGALVLGRFLPLRIPFCLARKVGPLSLSLRLDVVRIDREGAAAVLIFSVLAAAAGATYELPVLPPLSIERYFVGP